MKKVLVIGCSHCDCSYNYDDSFESERSWAWHLWDQRNRQEQFYVVPSPGWGITQYANILQHMNENNLLKGFNSCILQLTNEPRIIFPNVETGDLFLNNLEDFFKNSNQQYNRYVAKKGIKRPVTNGSRELYNYYADNFVDPKSANNFLDVVNEMSSAMTDTKFVKNIYPICYSFCINLLKSHNIKPAVFSFWNMSDEQKKCLESVGSDEIFLWSLQREANNRNQWNESDISEKGLHHNDNSSKKLGTILTESIKGHI